MADSPSLSTDAATVYLHLDIELACGVSSQEGELNIAAVLSTGEYLLIWLTVDDNLPATRK